MLTLRPYMLLAAIAWAILGTRRSPRLLRQYLITEFATTLVIEFAYRLVDVESGTYAAVYTVMRAVELVAALRLTDNKATGLVFGLSSICIALTGVHPVDRDAVITLLEGAAFLTAGASMALSIGVNTDRLTGGVLGVLWLLLGLFDYGYAMFHNTTAWFELNQWWPSVACILAFTMVGVARCPLARRRQVVMSAASPGA